MDNDTPDLSGLPLDVWDRFLAGDCTLDEAARVRAWAANVVGDPDAADRMRAEIQSIDAHTGAPPPLDIEAYLARLRTRLDLPPARRADRRPARRSRTWSGSLASATPPRAAWRVARAAAGIAAVAVGALTAWRAGWFASAQPVRQVDSAPGSRTDVTLRDGTRIVLGPATHLEVPSDFGRSTRTVTLSGEALFAVVHDARRPFAVRTSHTVTRDVGTTFAIRAYAGDTYERVAVVEGAVAVAGASLAAHDVALVDSSRRVTIERGADVAPYLAWAQATLVFKGTPFSEVVRELARTFNLEVTIADSTLGRQLITGSFGEQSVDEVLETITHVVGAHYERKGRVVVIRRGVVPVARPASSRAVERLTLNGRGR